MRILLTPAIVAITALVAAALPAPVKEAGADQVFKPTPEAARAEGVSLAKRIIEARGKGYPVDNNQCGQFVDYALAPESLTDHASKALWLSTTQRENWKLQAQAADLYAACEAALAEELEAFILGK